MTAPSPDDVLDFWFAPPASDWQTRWFTRTDTFDAACRDGFAAAVPEARAGAFDSWAETPRGALALLILLDQLPRNLYRDSPEAYASDPKARDVARAAIGRGLDQSLAPRERVFIYLPFEHSESLADQDLAVRLFEQLQGAPRMAAAIEYAHRHRDVIRRFGRFPHRNAILGRDSTPAELAFLAKTPQGF